jgi:anti-sigma B factor antagonist
MEGEVMVQLHETLLDKFTVVKVLDSRLDATVAGEFRQGLIEFIHKGQVFLILDLSDVEFIDSSGLGALVATLKTLGGQGDLVICGVQKPLLVLFELTRLDRVFRLYNDSKEAIEALSR